MVRRQLLRLGYFAGVGLLALSLVAGVYRQHAYADTYVADVVDLAGDDVVTTGTVPIGFNFDFYGTTYSDGYVSTNGNFTFVGSSNNTSGSLPTNAVQSGVFPFWTDLYTENGDAKSIYSKTIGDVGSRKFILQWTNMNYCCDTASPFGTIQMILYEGTNKVRFQYLNIQTQAGTPADNVTIGLQKDPATADVFSNNGSSKPASGTSAIEYTPNGSGGYTDHGHSVAVDEMTLFINDLPGEVRTYQPTNLRTGTSNGNVLLTWDSSPGATIYGVVVSAEPLLIENSFNSTFTAGNSWVMGGSLSPSTTYYWRVAAGNDKGYVYSEIKSFTTDAAGQAVPQAASNVLPATLIGGGIVDPTKLLSTPFTFDVSDPDSGQQVGYEFVLSTTLSPDNAVIDYMSPLGAQGNRSFKYGTTAGHYLKGSATTRLTDGQDYYLLIRTFDAAGAGTNLLAITMGKTFTYTATPTDDDDGTVLATENAAPNAGDANNDGFPDSWQDNVVSFVNPVTNKYSVLEVNGANPGDCHNQSVSAQTEAAQTTQDGSYTYPAGLMNFTVACSAPGATAKITQYFYGDYAGTMVARKYNPTTKKYADIPGAQVGKTTVGGLSAVRVEYFVTDGGALDQDGTANGVIVDPSGIAVVASNSIAAPNTGIKTVSMAPYYLSLLAGCGILMALIRRRDQR